MIIVAAAIIKNAEGKILITQRNEKDKNPLKWEFPGGKLEFGENVEECLKREIQEELGVGIKVLDFLGDSIYKYPKGTIRLMAYFAEINEGEIKLSVHNSFEWVEKNKLHKYDFLPADKPFLDKLAI